MAVHFVIGTQKFLRKSRGRFIFVQSARGLALSRTLSRNSVVTRNSRSVWTAVTSAPLFVRTRIIHISSLSARPTAPLKPAHSKRFEHFGSHHTTRQLLGGSPPLFPEAYQMVPMLQQLHLHPPALLCGFLNRRQHALVFQAVLKRRRHRFVLHTRIHKIGHRVDEGVFVTDHMPRRPPMVDIGLHPGASVTRMSRKPRRSFRSSPL